jgi:predicted DNA-binding transcriptional regulator AlpA
MSQRVKFRQGTKAENDAFMGVPGEITVNNDQNTIRVHDNRTLGGTELARSDLTNVTNGQFYAKAVAAGISSSPGTVPTTTLVPDGGSPGTSNFEFQFRRGNSSVWNIYDPVLKDGEIGLITDTFPRQFKIGDGNTAWVSLPVAGTMGQVLTQKGSASAVTDLAYGPFYIGSIYVRFATVFSSIPVVVATLHDAATSGGLSLIVSNVTLAGFTCGVIGISRGSTLQFNWQAT